MSSAYRLVRAPTAFALDRRRQPRGRARAPSHLAYIHALPCLACGSRRDVEAAHLRMADPASGKGHTGMGTKPDDVYVVPLCQACHRTGQDAQHASNEAEWWAQRGIEPCAVALALYVASGDEERGEAIVARARETRR